MIYFVAILANFGEIFSLKSGISFVGLVDEILLFATYLLVFYKVKYEFNKELYWGLSLPLLSIVLTLLFNFIYLNDLRFYQAFIQSFINFKFVIYLILFYVIDKFYTSDGIDFVKVLFVVSIISLVGYFLNIFLPSYFVISEDVWHVERNRILGFQFKPNDLAIFLSLLSVYIYLTTKGFLRMSLIGIMGLLIFNAGSRTADMIFISILIFAIIFSGKRKLMWLFLPFGLVFSGLYILDNLDYILATQTINDLSQFNEIDDTQYIRVIMIYLGFLLAIDFFPFGVGAGNFGSTMSEGSPIYEVLGVADNPFFVNMVGIYDSNFSSLVAEYGLILSLVIFYVLYRLLAIINIPKRESVWIYLIIIFISILQPMLSYSVNSINVTLIIMSLMSNHRKLEKNKYWIVQ